MKLDNFEKAFANFAKKWLVTDDEITALHEGWEYKAICQEVPGYDVRLFLTMKPQNRSLLPEVVKMWTYDDEKGRWYDDSEHAAESWNGAGKEEVFFNTACGGCAFCGRPADGNLYCSTDCKDKDDARDATGGEQ